MAIALIAHGGAGKWRPGSDDDALAGLTGLAVTDDVDLRETFAGEWQGLTRTELEERFGADLQQWAAGAEIRPGGGETRREVATRMVAAVDRDLADMAPGETLVVATHGGAARAAIGALLGLPIEHWAALGAKGFQRRPDAGRCAADELRMTAPT
jgi:probable phosphoglycerate mutase